MKNIVKLAAILSFVAGSAFAQPRPPVAAEPTDAKKVEAPAPKHEGKKHEERVEKREERREERKKDREEKHKEHQHERMEKRQEHKNERMEENKNKPAQPTAAKTN